MSAPRERERGGEDTAVPPMPDVFSRANARSLADWNRCVGFFSRQRWITDERGEGGTIAFKVSDCETECDGSTPILVAGEEAGLELPFGCREGICHTCVGTLREGKVRDLRTGKVHGNQGETVRTCIHAPEGPIEIEL